jgi:hypothetical protein
MYDQINVEIYVEIYDHIKYAEIYVETYHIYYVEQLIIYIIHLTTYILHNMIRIFSMVNMKTIFTHFKVLSRCQTAN